jgi:hypothetical protein
MMTGYGEKCKSCAVCSVGLPCRELAMQIAEAFHKSDQSCLFTQSMSERYIE